VASIPVRTVYASPFVVLGGALKLLLGAVGSYAIDVEVV